MAGFFKKLSGKKNTSDTEEKKLSSVAASSKELSAFPAGENARDEEDAATQTVSSPVASAVGLGSAKFIIKPLITEKGTFAAEHRTYLFHVALNANKRAIKEAVQKLYGVSVTAVHTARFRGKAVRYGRVTGQRSNFKKAFVTVAKGQTITIHKHV